MAHSFPLLKGLTDGNHLFPISKPANKFQKDEVCPVLHTARCTSVATLEERPLHSELVSGKDTCKVQDRKIARAMKKKETDVRNKMLKVRMNEPEMQQLRKLQLQTTEKEISNYVRRVVLQQPVIVTYRNKSADDFLKEMLLLRKELNSIGNNFNQAVHKLHLLEKIPDFRAWLQQNENLQRTLVGKVEEIRLRMAQLYDQWLQK